MNEQNQTIKQFNHEIIPMYIHTIFLFLIWIRIMKFFDVRAKLNNNILKYSDPKCTNKNKPLQIYCHIIQSSNILF